MELLSLSGIEAYGNAFHGGFGYLPFTNGNDSNPYVLCCDGPLRGMIVHVFHDDEARLICREFARFLALVAEAHRNGEDVSLLDGDYSFERAARTNDDAEVAQALVHAAELMDVNDSWRAEALRFAIQLFGPGQENELANLLGVGDEYTRDAVLRRWKGLGTEAAQKLIREDANEFQGFIVEFRKRVEAEGLKAESTGNGGFRIVSGNVHPNFEMLFTRRHDPSGLDEFVRRFKEWSKK
jgi:hypothetical protein